MNLDRWLQLRREGRLSIMPLGMRTAMAAFGDQWSVFDMFVSGNGGGYGGEGGGYIRRFGDGFGNTHGDGYGNGHGAMAGHGVGDGGLHEDKDGNSLEISRITQRFHKANR